MNEALKELQIKFAAERREKEDWKKNFEQSEQARIEAESKLDAYRVEYEKSIEMNAHLYDLLYG